AKLADGKIWMTKNLNLAGDTEITSELSDIPENYTLPTANGFQEGNRLPRSSQIGFDNNTIAYVYNSGNNTDNCTSPGCYSYYSWNAVTAGSGINIAANTDAPYSICPRGWRLPNSTNSDFSGLVAVYGSGENFYHNAGPGTVANFLPAGNVGGFGSGSGLYYISTSTNGTVSKIMRFWPTFVYSSTDFYKKSGLSVRCLAR
ncbi:hypothetical protein IJJ53_02295, partial [Candidatus Saccharibacteria bacterium]|nr:hypothetical protein [Candidatus Saccharibacteria bacterium]